MKHILLFIVLLAASLCLADAADIEVLHRSVIFRHTGSDPRDPANSSGMNHAPSVVLLPDGRLMAAWYSCPFEGSPRQRIVHSFSPDQGRTWSAAATLQDSEGRPDFDPSFVADGEQTFMFFSVDNPLRIHYRCSNDSGRTWSAPVEIGQPNHTSRSNGIRLATGELLVPLHMRGTKAGGVLKSRDGGRTWTRFGAVASPEGQGGEPTIAELRSGKVLMLLRTKDGEVWRSVSADKGETWSAPEKTGLPGAASSHHLLRARDGTLVLTHNPSKPPHRFPLTMRLSLDEGATWREPVVLADRPENAAGWQVSYPSAVELPDGTVAVVWTQIRAAKGMVHGDIHAAWVALRREGPAVPHVAESRYGAAANDTGNPIGGGKGYSRIVTGGDVRVSTAEELIGALKSARRGQVVFVVATELDLRGAPPLQVGEGVTLAGSRGHNGVPGPLLRFNLPGKAAITALAGSRVTGLRLQGGDGPAVTADGKRTEKKSGAIAIAVRGDKVEVDNCEIFEFHHSGVNVQARETHVHHCDLHDIHAYPVVVGDKAGLPVLIEANVIRYTWHAVAGTGKPGTGYEARFNVVKEASPKVYHDYNLGRNTFAFDMHEYRPALPAKWIAATRVHVHHNTVLDLDEGRGIAPPSPGVVIRGIPLEGADIRHNWFVHHTDPQRIFQQRNATGNCRVHDNVHGPDRKPVPEDLFKKNAERVIITP